ncbi:MAG: ABC transporter substrate-binding protein [Acetobacteraceae bacterium]
MLTRRTMLGSAAAAPLIWNQAFAETPRDVAVMAMQIDDLISIDPGESFEFSGNEIGANCYERLVVPDRADPTKIVGVVADTWEVSSDALTYTFHLKQDRKFASGAPITAEDAAWSLQRAVIMNKAPGFILTQFGLTKDNVAANIRATDDHTLVIKIGQATAPTFLFYCLSANIGSVIEKKLALSHAVGDDLANGWLKSASAGSNAWILRSWRASESVSLEAASGRGGKLKRMIIRHVSDPSAQLLLLQKGDADIVRNLNPEQLRAVKDKPAYALQSCSTGVLNYIAMNQDVKALANPDVTAAIKWAIDYDAIAQNITPDIFKVHQAFLPEGFPGALNANPLHKDVDKAKALLKQAGFADGFEVTLDHQSNAPWSDVAQAIQADLGAIGIKVTLIAGEFRQVITKTRARQHQMAMLRWGSDYMDPHSNAQTFCVNEDNTDAATNRTVAWRSKWQDLDLTGRAQDALRETDAAKRIADYEQLQKDFMHRSPFAIFLQQVSVAVLRKGVAGFELGVLSDDTVYSDLAKA